jgi:hypothetical protein
MEPIDQAQRLIKIFGDLAPRVVKEIKKAKGGSYYWDKTLEETKKLLNR